MLVTHKTPTEMMDAVPSVSFKLKRCTVLLFHINFSVILFPIT